MRRLMLALGLALVLPAALLAAPRGAAPPAPVPPPGGVSPMLQRAAAAVVGVRVEVPTDRASVPTLGHRRWGSGVIFDEAGHLVTVSYVLLDAGTVEVTLRDGRRVPARLVGLDLETGLGIAKLAWPGPWPAALLGDSTRVVAGQPTATVGMDDDGDLVATQGRVEAIQPYSAPWEYMLDRAIIVAPANPAFGGAALVDAAGAVIGITSLRLGMQSPTNLAIPIEKLLAVKDELIARGRVESRRARPWLGLYTETIEGSGVVVMGVSPAGPAGAAGFRRGDIIVRLAGETVASQTDFYTRLWERKIGEDLVVVVRRDGRFEALTVRPADRYRVYHTSGR